MVKIKADEDCKSCGGTGWYMPFIALRGQREDGMAVCLCILEQIEIVPAKGAEI